MDTSAVEHLLQKASEFTQTDFDSMNYYATKAMEFSETSGFSTGIIQSKYLQANFFRRKGDYSRAVSSLLENIRLCDSMEMKREKLQNEELLANVYKEMGGEKLTNAYLYKGLELAREVQVEAEKNKYFTELISAYNVQGIIFRDLSKEGKKNLMDSALSLYLKAIQVIQTSGEGKNQLAKLYNNISQVYNEHFHDYNRALEYLMKAVSINEKNKNFTSLSFNFGNISEVYLNMKNPIQAEKYAHKMLQVSSQLNAPHRILNAYSQLIRVHKAMQQYDSALYYREQFMAVTDSLTNVQKTGQIAEMQTRFETKEKESKIAYLNQLNKEKNQRFLLSMFAMVILVLFAVLLIIQIRSLKKQRKQIAEQSERLQWMMKELHHRVKNNLQIVSSLLNLQVFRLSDEESVQALKESQQRVQAMSLIHQRLYQEEKVTMVNFKSYCYDLVESLMKAYGYDADQFDLQIKIENELLDVDTVMPLALLLNEIITNSFKYAYNRVSRPALQITLSQNHDHLQLEISDNGPGIKEKEEKEPGFGKKLIEALSRQIRATYTIKSENGTNYTFMIPNKQQAA